MSGGNSTQGELTFNRGNSATFLLLLDLPKLLNIENLFLGSSAVVAVAVFTLPRSIENAFFNRSILLQAKVKNITKEERERE